jgi:GNAT superfamily N-acetyltransferase
MNGTQMAVAPAAAISDGTAYAPRAKCLAAGSAKAGSYCVREGGPEDQSRIRDFAAGLSEQTRYLRFFTAITPASPGLLRALAGGIPGTDILVITDEQGAVVGHGMAADITADGRPGVDLGLVIADAWQGQGLGTVLFELLVQRAAARGARALAVEVLPGNSRMLALLRKHWPNAPRTWTGDAYALSADLGEPLQPGAVEAPSRPGRQALAAAA